MSDPLENPDFDLDEDLFDFARVSVDPYDEAEASEEDLADVLASFREAPEADEEAEAPEDLADLVEPLAAVEEPEPEPEPEPVAAAPAQAAVKKAAVKRTTAPAAPVRAEPESATPPVTVVPAAAPARISRGLVAVAISMTVLNSVLAIVFLQRLPGSHEEVRADGAPEASHEAPREPAPAPAHGVEEREELPDPDLAGRVHGHPALDEAREELARGDYAACRQHAYALLSVIDRYEDPRREEIEAECQFLIAQSLHLEALARLGRSE